MRHWPEFCISGQHPAVTAKDKGLKKPLLMRHRTARFEPIAADLSERPDRAQGQKDSTYEHAVDLPSVDLGSHPKLKPLPVLKPKQVAAELPSNTLSPEPRVEVRSF